MTMQKDTKWKLSISVTRKKRNLHENTLRQEKSINRATVPRFWNGEYVHYVF